MGMDKVIVLMSSYNGQEFITEQIDSILNQTNADINLIIRDDGSTDNTLNILKNYRTVFPEKIEIIEGSNIGWRASFFKLISYAGTRYADHDFFAFADQDDIWLPDKTQRAIEKLNHYHDIPSLYFSNLLYYKDGKNYGLIRKDDPPVTYKRCLVKNQATGCTVIFNRELLIKLIKGLPEIPVAHDYWSYMVACLCGKVLRDEEAFILYRQHDNNQIGYKSGIINVWKRRFKNMRSLLTDRERENTAKELLRIHEQNMFPEAKEAVKNIAFYRRSLKKRVSLLFDSEYSLDNKSKDFWLKIRVFLGLL